MTSTATTNSKQSPQYLCVLERTPSGYSAFAADFDFVLVTGRTKNDVLSDLSQELLALEKSGPLPTPKASESDFVGEDAELSYVSPAKPNLVSRQLEDLMRSEGMKQKDVAHALGVSSAAVSRLTSPYYHGHTMESLQKMANVLGYEVEVSFKKTHS